MRFRRGAQLDTGQVSDRRGMGGPLAVGGGGIIGLIVLVVSLLSEGGGSGITPLQFDEPSTDLSAECRTGEDANQRDDCRIVGVINSVQAHWSESLDGYEEAPTVFFSGVTSSGCGQADSSVGPFYCPPDQTNLHRPRLLRGLAARLRRQGRTVRRGLCHRPRVRTSRREPHRGSGAVQDGSTGPASSAVKVELMADCLAGVWASGAVNDGFIEELTDADIAAGLDAAAAVGDDRIQQRAQGSVNPEAWTHGSSEQRQQWFRTGYEGGELASCDTFAG